MKIGFDIFGGDNSPAANIAAANRFAQYFPDVELVVFGNETIINETIDSSLTNIKIVNAPDKILGEDEPTVAIRRKKESSIVVGANALKNDEIDCFVSAGNTGALVAAGVFIVKRLKGVDRPALPGVMPSKNNPNGVLLLDLGANIDAKPEQLVQYAKMAKVYKEKILNCPNPQVNLLNIGAEETKGTELYRETYNLLKESDLNFGGNVEPRYILETDTDIIVMDGFVGNMVLKTLEGSISFMKNTLKEVFLSSLKTKIGALLIKGKFEGVKKQLDYNGVGGTPILGLDKLMVKAHGSSSEDTFYNALVSAKNMVESNIIEEMKKGVNNE